MSARALKPSDNSAAQWRLAVWEEIEAVEQCLSMSVLSKVPAIFQISDHLLSAGGKRLRPALVALCAKAIGNHYDLDQVIKVGTAVELIHMATLVHDDVIDQTGVRRGRSTANSSWGNKISVLSGDHMLSKAFCMLSSDIHSGILQTLSSMTVTMSESEVLQAVCEGNLDLWREHYFDIVRGKTAGFFASCCKSGGIIGGAEQELQESLYSYGMHLGVAFQITDDILDIAGSPSKTGKSIGADIREGKYTLPLLLTIDNASGPTRDSLMDILGNANISEEDMALVRGAAERTGAIRMAMDTAAVNSAHAVKALATIPEGAVKEALSSLAVGVVGRGG